MKNFVKYIICLVFSLYILPAFSLANPASVNCVEKGNQLILIKSTGICIFADGSYCEEWAFYRGTCTAGTNTFPGGKYDKTQLSQYCLSDDKPPVVKMCQ